jgi:hypothetical protein
MPIAMTAEPLPRVARPEYLIKVLNRAGALGDARVGDVVVESEEAEKLWGFRPSMRFTRRH